MTDRHVSRIVIEFYADSEEEHDDKSERIADFADSVVCPSFCDMDTCRLVGLTIHRLTLEQFDREMKE